MNSFLSVFLKYKKIDPCIYLLDSLTSFYHMKPIKSFLPIALLIASLSLAALPSTAQKLIPPPSMQAIWSQDYEPFRIAGNLYYVGTYDLGCYLITTPQGHIRINSGLPGS